MSGAMEDPTGRVGWDRRTLSPRVETGEEAVREHECKDRGHNTFSPGLGLGLSPKNLERVLP